MLTGWVIAGNTCDSVTLPPRRRGGGGAEPSPPGQTRRVRHPLCAQRASAWRRPAAGAPRTHAHTGPALLAICSAGAAVDSRGESRSAARRATLWHLFFSLHVKNGKESCLCRRGSARRRSRAAWCSPGKGRESLERSRQQRRSWGRLGRWSSGRGVTDTSGKGRRTAMRRAACPPLAGGGADGAAGSEHAQRTYASPKLRLPP